MVLSRIVSVIDYSKKIERIIKPIVYASVMFCLCNYMEIIDCIHFISHAFLISVVSINTPIWVYLL